MLETQFPDMVETQPELLAYHYTKAGQNDAAIGYWQQAGQGAIRGSAYMGGIAHLERGLALLMMGLPETSEHLQQELDFQVALGPALMSTKGYAAPDVERVYVRARELCQKIGNTPQLFPTLRGLVLYYQTQGQLQTATQLGEQLLRLAQSQDDPALLMLAHNTLGVVLFNRGEPGTAHTHHNQALAIYTAQEHRAWHCATASEQGAASHSFLAWELWHLGYPDQAIQHSQESRTLAQEASHLHSLAIALLFSAILHQFRRETLAAHKQAEAMITLATKQEDVGRTAWEWPYMDGDWLCRARVRRA